MANMFKSTLASSGGAIILTVTCDAEFAGLTITATDGTTTLTQTCPSTSPYEVEFNIPNSGQWTISGVISGDTKSIIVNIPSTAVLHNTPNGSTVTPTDDIQTWLHCADILDKNYTTLAHVLADTSTFQALIASHNAVDYMARSATWIGGNRALVPTMTSDTQPSGVASASAVYSTNTAAWKAFDGNDSTYFSVGTAATLGSWLQYEFTEEVRVTKISIKPLYDTNQNKSYVKDIIIKGSNNGTDFTTIANETVANNANLQTFTFTNNNFYKIYRVEAVTSYMSNGYAIGTLQFHESTGIVDDQSAMTYIGLDNYCANTLLNDAYWRSGICHSAYFESILNVKVPTMTSNTEPSGVCFASTTYGGNYVAWKAFDKITNTYWSPTNGSTTNQHLGYQFPISAKVYMFDILTASSKPPKNCKIQYSSDGSNYSDACDFTLSNTGNKTTRIYIDNTASAEYWRLFMSNGYVTDYIYITEVQFYGRIDV